MRIGISALLFNIQEALDICKNIKKINHIEIGIDNLDECDEIYKYKEEINNLGLSVGIHLPMELNTCENIAYIRNSWVNFINKINDNLKYFEIRYFNLHLGYVMTNRFKKNKYKYLDNSIKFLDSDKLNKDIIISIENTYSKHGDFSNVGNIAQDFEYIFSKVKNNNIYFCYDTGHYLINSDDYLGKLREKTKIIHLSDNDGVDDIHIGIGKGMLSQNHIEEVLELKPEYLVLEISYEDIEDTINKLESIIGEV